MIPRKCNEKSFTQLFQEDKEKAVIELPGGKKLVAYALEGQGDKDPPQIIVTLTDEYDMPAQDLVAIQALAKKEYQVLVMGNEEDDTSYTDSIVIKERPEPEPEPPFNADQYDDWEGHYYDHDEGGYKL